MSLEERLQRDKATLANRWLDMVLGTYPPDASTFFKKRGRRFTNPVGQTMADETSALLDDLLQGAPAEQLCKHLDEIIRLRAVQDFTPARAVCFVFLLKDAIRELLAKELDQVGLAAELLEFESRIDQLALFAFDIFTKYRQKSYELRVEEIKRQVSSLMRRSGMFLDDSETDPDRQPGCN